MRLIEKEELEDSYERWDIQVSKNSNFVAARCVVHNSNFSVYFDGTELKLGKRSGWIQEGEAFFGCQALLPQIQPFAANLYSMIGKPFQIFGEIFGGGYDHPDVPKFPCSRVQREVQYSPKTELMFFDILVDGNYLPTEDVEQYVKAAGFFPHAPRLFKGSLDECLAYNNEFVTTIPKMLGYPELPDNICEGVVIKPAEARYLPNGDRIIIKSKNPKFSENKGALKAKPAATVNEAVQKVLEQIQPYINPVRAAAVCSKHGEVTIKDFGKLYKPFMDDVREDFLKENPEAFAELQKEDSALFGKMFAGNCSECLRNFLLKG